MERKAGSKANYSRRSDDGNRGGRKPGEKPLRRMDPENSVMAGRNLCNKLWNISRFIQSIVAEIDPNNMADANGYTTDNMGEDWICREIKC